MKKVFLFDQIECDLYACYFEGMDDDGKPRLTMITPGYPVENLLKYFDKNNESVRDYYLLCEEGKPADSQEIIKMMGHMFLNIYPPFQCMSARLREMRMYGINYDHELQDLTVRIFEYEDAKSNRKKYNVLMYVGADDKYISEGYFFDKIEDVFVNLRGFFHFVESEVHIPLKKHLVVSESLKKQAKRIADFFDEIDA